MNTQVGAGSATDGVAEGPEGLGVSAGSEVDGLGVSAGSEMDGVAECVSAGSEEAGNFGEADVAGDVDELEDPDAPAGWPWQEHHSVLDPKAPAS